MKYKRLISISRRWCRRLGRHANYQTKPFCVKNVSLAGLKRRAKQPPWSSPKSKSMVDRSPRYRKTRIAKQSHFSRSAPGAAAMAYPIRGAPQPPYLVAAGARPYVRGSGSAIPAGLGPGNGGARRRNSRRTSSELQMCDIDH